MSEVLCRFCRAPLGRVFVDLGMSPLSNAFVRAEDLHRVEPFYPLRVYVCEGCLLVQLPPTERAEAIFCNEYLYFSSYSPSWLEHARRYALAMTERLRLGPRSLVVELASNDGYLLQYFKQAGIPVLGVEPSGGVAKVAVEEHGIPTEVCFFGVETARRLRAQGYTADLLCGNNVLAHVPDLHDFVGGMPLVLAEGGVVTVEFPHLLRLMSEIQFDTIYQEHYSYFSFGAAKRAFEAHGLRVFDVEELSTHGGSLRVYACHAGNAALPTEPSVEALLAKERAEGLDRIEGYDGYRAKVDQVKRDLLAFLIEAKRAGKRVAGYGAPAKGNTLLNYCGIRTDFLDFTVDLNPYKQHTFLPGTHIPVFPPQRLDEERPDYILILPWNLQAEIAAQLSYVRSWGCKLVVAIPRLSILP